MSDAGCPPLSRLRQLAAGGVPEPELADLGAHLDGCPVCRETLDQLMAHSGVWPVPAGSPGPGQPGPALAQVLARLSVLPAVDQTSVVDSPEYDVLGQTVKCPEHSRPPFAFLEPSDKPGYLGRLGVYE